MKLWLAVTARARAHVHTRLQAVKQTDGELQHGRVAPGCAAGRGAGVIPVGKDVPTMHSPRVGRYVPAP